MYKLAGRGWELGRRKKSAELWDEMFWRLPR